MCNSDKKLDSELAASISSTIGELQADNGTLYFLENAFSDDAKYTKIKKLDHTLTEEELPIEKMQIGSKVYSYGGGELLCQFGHIFYIEKTNQTIHVIYPNGKQEKLFQEDGLAFSLSDFHLENNNLLLICQKGDHNFIGLINLQEKQLHHYVEGADFYSSAKFSPNGFKACWIEWDFPHMPWDATHLICAEISNDKKCQFPKKIAGGISTSIQQPKWYNDETIFFISDEHKGWWNIYKYSLSSQSTSNLLPMEAEFGYPPWTLGTNSYEFRDEEHIVSIVNKNAEYYLVELNIKEQTMNVLCDRFTEYGDQLCITGDTAFFEGHFEEKPSAITKFDLVSLQYESREEKQFKDKIFFSKPISYEFPVEAMQTAYGFFYPAHNADLAEAPLLIKCHGGPTSQTTRSWHEKVQYWVSRGFSVFDINYRGSTGFGKAYRDSLYGQMGVYDIEDCLSAVHFCLNNQLANSEKIFISGGSAGGYIVLMCLLSSDLFSAGTAYYPISDITTLLTEAEKFEKRYFDLLIGPYPEAESLYQERSPIHHISKIQSPICFFQGMQDPITPASQTQAIVEELKNNHIYIEDYYFEDESHGFRNPKTVAKCLDTEYEFYQKIMQKSETT